MWMRYLFLTLLVRLTGFNVTKRVMSWRRCFIHEDVKDDWSSTRHTHTLIYRQTQHTLEHYDASSMTAVYGHLSFTRRLLLLCVRMLLLPVSSLTTSSFSDFLLWLLLCSITHPTFVCMWVGRTGKVLPNRYNCHNWNALLRIPAVSVWKNER